MITAALKGVGIGFKYSKVKYGRKDCYVGGNYKAATRALEGKEKNGNLKIFYNCIQ
jgi:hypothetical protein